MSTFLVLIFAFAYGSQSANSAEKPEAAQTVRVEDVSKYSPMVLSDMKSMPAIDMGKGMTFRLELEEPSTDDKAINAARKAIGETPAVQEAAKKKLATMLKDDDELNVPWENDAWLTRFLRLKNYDVPKTYKLIKSYYNFKAKNSSLYKDLVPSKLKEVAVQGVEGVLPNRDPTGSRILWSSIRRWNPKAASLRELLRLAIFFAETSAYEPATQLTGMKVIFDTAGLTWQHIRQFNPKNAKLIVQWMLTSAPVKIQEIHILNQSRAFDMLINIFKPFMTEQLRSKIHFHGANVKSLHQYIPASSLPDILGGSYPKRTFSDYEWDVVLRSLDKEFTKLNSYGMKRKN